MRKVFFELIIVFSSHISAQEKSNIDLVNTLIGTKPWSGKIQLAGPELAEGHTYPGVGSPFAMTEWTPKLQSTLFHIGIIVNSYRSVVLN